jgi:nicotinamidase-related amidase
MEGTERVDRDRSVLVVVDVQERLAAVMPRRGGVAATSSRLVRTADVLGIPVVVTRQYPKGLGDTVPEVASAVDELETPAPVVDKTTFCCSDEPAFDAVLDEIGREQVVLVGMETHICVTQTALALRAAGRPVFVVADGVCSRDDRDHEVALARLRAAGVVVATSESVMYEALGRAGTPEFKAVLEIVKDA